MRPGKYYAGENRPVSVREIFPERGAGRLRSRPEFSAKTAETALRFHKSLPEYRETPLISLSHLSGELGVGGIYVKDESWRFGLNAFKGLGGAYAMFRILCRRLGLDPEKRTLELFRRRRSESAYRRSPLQRPPTEITGRAFPGQRSCSGAAPGCLCRRVLLRRGHRRFGKPARRKWRLQTKIMTVRWRWLVKERRARLDSDTGYFLEGV